jgi:ABC-type multidrug transport system ATPase subunit
MAKPCFAVLAVMLALASYHAVNGQNRNIEAGNNGKEEMGCVVEFVIDELQSSVELRSRVVRPLPVDFEMNNSQFVNQGLMGSLYMNVGTGPCSRSVPTGADLLGSLDQGTTLVTYARSPVLFFPSNITLSADTVGTVVNIWDLGFDISLGVKMDGDDLAGELRSESSSGDVFTTSIIAPDGEQFPFGRHESQSISPVYTVVNGSSLLLNITNFNITMAVPYISEINPNIEGLTYYQFLGNLVLKGVAGCDMQACEPNGRCGVDSSGSTICDCRCGWSGPTCSLSSGFCSEYQGYTSTLSYQTPACPNADSPLPPAPVAASPPCSANVQSTCNPMFQTFDALENKCICRSGWSGPECEACNSDAACMELYKSEGVTCGTSVIYSSETAFKSYTCDLNGTGLESTIVPGTFYVTCNTTSPGDNVSVNDGSYCLVNFAMQQDPDNSITCKASLCSFVGNSSQVNCRTTSCTCERECPDLDGVFSKIQNRPAVIGCDSENTCSFDIENFFVKLIASCKTTECRVQGYNFEDGSYRVKLNTWVDPMLASIPLIVLLISNLSLFVYLFMHRDLYFARFWRTGRLVAENLGQDAQLFEKDTNSKVHMMHRLSFRDLRVVLNDAENRVLLDGLSGEAFPGQMIGIMGPSGSGKTTLISALSQRPMPPNTTLYGKVTLDNIALSAAHGKIIGLCPQDSCLIPTLTVYETILYSAILRLPRDTDTESIHSTTREAIRKVRLDSVMSSQVGGYGRIRGISGGERRRVSVAMEIVINPKVLLLDEPLSGLDSSSAKQVISALKSLAGTDCIVMLSLHQPSPAIFNMLDSVLLLASGRCLYNGPPSGINAFFDGFDIPKPTMDDTPDFLLECASEEQIVNKIVRSQRGCPAGPMDKLVDCDDIELQSVSRGGRERVCTLRPPHGGAALTTELATLTWRNTLDILRNPSLLILHCVLALGMGVFAGCVFFQVGLDTAGAQNRAGGLIFALAFFAFTSLTTVDLIFTEKRIASREINSGYYRRWTYVVSKLVLDGLFLRFLPTLLFSAPFYPMMGLDSDPHRVALFLMILGTFAVAVGALSLAMTLLSRSAGQASFAMNIILLVCLLNSGFFVNAENMPDWVSWLRYISFFFYGYSVLITNEVAGLLFNFVVEGYTAVENVRGATFLSILGVNPNEMTNYIIILDCMYAIFCLITLLFSYSNIRDM